ncbi:MAG: phage major capsid protein, partial [Acidobacteria bacterium]|nr:phage major capsid protein [Acidobacteriota bacterium]
MKQHAKLELLAEPLALRVTGSDGKSSTWPLDPGQAVDTGTALVVAARAVQERRKTMTGIEHAGRWSDGIFRTLGEQLACVVRADEDGVIDPRLNRVALASGLHEGVGSEGGFLVQTDFSNQLLGAAMESSLLVPRCTRIPISNSSNSVKVPVVNETSRADGSR